MPAPTCSETTCYKSVGCYTNTLPVMLATFPANTLKLCAETVKAAGYRYMGVKAGTGCYAGVDLVTTVNGGPATGCTTPCPGMGPACPATCSLPVAMVFTCSRLLLMCPGDSSQACGGSSVASIYEVDLPLAPTRRPPMPPAPPGTSCTNSLSCITNTISSMATMDADMALFPNISSPDAGTSKAGLCGA